MRSVSWIQSTKARLFPRGVRRWGAHQMARVAARTSQRDFSRAISRLGIAPGSVVCVHAAMSGFGHLPDGFESVFAALQDTVRGCTVFMPSFPFDGSMLEHLASDPVFDPQSTPSRSGSLSESLRHVPGVRRGCHPTHACLALGPQAGALLDGTAHCPTPFGDDSTYGRYSRLPNAVLLLLHTNSTSHVHRLQEIVGWPNLFLPGTVAARGYDANRAVQTFHVRVHRPKLPLFAVVPGAGGETRYLWLPDYAVQFPSANRQRILARLEGTEAARWLSERQDTMLRAGHMRVVPCGPGEIMAIDLQPWQSRLCADLRESFERWPAQYSLAALEEANGCGALR